MLTAILFLFPLNIIYLNKNYFILNFKLFIKKGGKQKIKRLLYFPIAIMIFGFVIIIKRIIS